MTTTDKQTKSDNGTKADDQAKANTRQPTPPMPDGPMMSVATGVKIYGEPIVTQGRTLIPVSTVAMGFSGGFWGRLQGAVGNAAATTGLVNEGQGQAGVVRRIRIRPVGYIDITSTQSHFVTIAPGRFVALGVGLALMLGGLMIGGRRRMRRNR